MTPTHTPTPGDGKEKSNANTLDPSTVRVMCAEEMGWKKEHDGLWHLHDDHPDYPAELIYSELPNFAESADAALALVEKMESEGWDISIDFIGKGRRCVIWNDSTDHEASADHPAMATALCFLKARGRAL